MINKLTLAILGMGFGLVVCGPALAGGPAGRVQSVGGEVLLQRGVSTDSAENGLVLQTGDTLVTGDTGKVQWRMSDDSLFFMAANSGIEIANYSLPTMNAPDGTADYTLVHGAFRTITGKIGQSTASTHTHTGEGHLMNASMIFRRNPAYFVKVVGTGPAKASAYIVKTALASVTTQGADLAVAQLASGPVGVKVIGGKADVCNGAGCASPGAGQFAIVTCATCKPVIKDGEIDAAFGTAFAALQFLPDPSLQFGANIDSPVIPAAPIIVPPNSTSVSPN